MADLVVRAGGGDAALLERVLTARTQQRPHRVVVDAHVAVSAPSISAAARRAGAPFLVDPQTHYLQGTQHSEDPWARLPFARSQAYLVPDLLDAGRQDMLAASVAEYQMEHGATALIPPYVHVERADVGWVQVQLGLWRATRRYLDRQHVHIPVIAVVALGWRELDPSAWSGAVHPLRNCLLHELHPTEVALAASKVDSGVYPAERLSRLIAVVRQLRRHWPVLAWQQGTLGEAVVAAGAAGYECGIGWRERCDLGAQIRSHRETPNRRAGSARPVYITALRRSLPKRSVNILVRNHPGVAADLTCLDAACCPGGQQALLGDARAHAIAARRRELDEIVRPARPAWRWNQVARGAATGLERAERINALAARTPGLTRVDTAALAATLELADYHRQATTDRAA